MKEQIKKLYKNDVIRYIFFGGCTTMVNLAAFYFLRRGGISENLANIASIVLAILFAYVVNARFVFTHRADTWKEAVQTFGKFIGARIVGMGIEVGGFWLLVTILGCPDLLGKTAVQFLVIAINYILSKFFVFK